ncbi:FAD-dependent monooxygenase [Aquirhabdus sp.]|uniref:FAD-dependent monooxygenase n=1 Tax=Aquirhabdus sp. TaxID=2824160 RepID=UPI00396C6332
MNQMTFSTPKQRVLIVGAGPVGLTLAIQLHRYGIPYRLIEKNEGPSTYTKAMAVHSRTLEIFDEIGIADQAINAGHQLNRFRIQSYGKTVLTYNFSLLDAKYPFLLCLPQSKTEEILLKKLQSLGGNVEWQTELASVEQSAEEIQVTLKHPDGESIVKTNWLMACDGGRSAVRRQLGLSFEGALYHSHFMLADVDIAWEGATDEGVFFLGDQAGYVAVAPLNEQNRYRLFIEMPYDLPPESERLPLDLETFQRLCDGRGQTMKLSNISSETTAAFQQRRVPQLQIENVFLLGDAAHIGSPIGGQYMNMGIAEAHNLAWKLAFVEQGRAHPYLLNSYDAERRPVAIEVERTAKSLTKILTIKHKQLVKLRDSIFPKLSELTPIQRKLPWMISGHRYNYHQSPIVQDLRLAKPKRIKFSDGKFNIEGLSDPKAGDLAPDIELWRPRDKQPLRLIDLYKQKFVLLLLTGGDEFSPELEDWAKKSQVISKYYSVIQGYLVLDALSPPENLSTAGVTTLLDPDWRLHRRYGLRSGGFVLIRPDGYIGFLGESVEGLEHYLQQYSMLFSDIDIEESTSSDVVPPTYAHI